MFGGRTYTEERDGWQVSWESLDDYRFWCSQEHHESSNIATVVMLNPGSLSGSGVKLGRDTTLRVLRDIFFETGYNPFIINLFNLATPNPDELFRRWDLRDHPAFNYSKLPQDQFSAVMYAYGDYEKGEKYPQEIKSRIAEVRGFLSHVSEIILPRNQSGTPKHPLSVQRQGLVDEFRRSIFNHASRS